jgi:hypothetical protein
MTEPGLRQPPLVARAHRLLAISSIAPVVVALAITIMMLLLGGDLEGGYVFFLVFTMACLVIIAWLSYWHFHYTPDAWRTNPVATIYIAAAFFLPLMFANSEDLRSGLDMPTFSVVAVLLILGIFFVGWFPAREAARLVLDDLSSPDVVNSSLVIRFRSRVQGAVLSVDRHFRHHRADRAP